MLIIPEIETVVILPPRTGTGSLYRRVLEAYPKAMMPYRHMEADGVPFGYDRWRRVGVLRHPESRMWSLYNYLKTFGIEHAVRPEYDEHNRIQRSQVEGRTFEEWLVDNQIIFTSQHDQTGQGGFHPQYACKHPYAENRKSQFYYLRPDLGTEIIPYTPDASAIGAALGIEVPRTTNVVAPGEPPLLGILGRDHMSKFHRWDFEACESLSIPLA